MNWSYFLSATFKECAVILHEQFSETADCINKVSLGAYSVTAEFIYIYRLTSNSIRRVMERDNFYLKKTYNTSRSDFL